MAAPPHAVAQGLRRARSPRWFDDIRAKCRCESVLQPLREHPKRSSTIAPR